MLKAVLLSILIVNAVFCPCEIFAQEQQTRIRGEVEEFLPEQGVVIIDGQEIVIPESERGGWYLEEGDSIEIITKNTGDGLVAVDYDFLWEDEDENEDENKDSDDAYYYEEIEYTEEEETGVAND